MTHSRLTDVRIPDGVPDTQPVEVVRLKRDVRSEIDRALRMVVPLIAACVLGLVVAGCYLADIASSVRAVSIKSGEIR